MPCPRNCRTTENTVSSTQLCTALLTSPAARPRVPCMAEPVACADLFKRGIQRFAGYVQQLLRFRPNLSGRHRHGRIRESPVHFRPEIYRVDVALEPLTLE